jgi:hypothetical protein
VAVESRHPCFDSHIADWEACRDVYHGQSAVRARDQGVRYLPPTTGQVIDGAYDGHETRGWKNYCAYRNRALLGGFFSDAVDMYMGMLGHKPTTIELGPLESVFGNGKPATSTGESLAQLLRRMHAEALITARHGLFADLPPEEASTPQPYIELYQTEQITNWDDGARNLARRMLNLVVLDESGPAIDANLAWTHKERYRVLWLGSLSETEATGAYGNAVLDKGENFDPAKLTSPVVRNRRLDEIPFVFVGTKSITTQVDDPPLMALAWATLALYRMDADYRQHIHMQGQDTLFTSGVGADEVSSVGAGAHIRAENPNADGKFIGINSQGLGETRQAIQNDQTLCAKKSGEMLADNSKQRESGDALVERTGRKGASLVDIADTCAAGLERMLRIIAKWLGHSPAQCETIKVIPNKKFGTPKVVPGEMKQLVEAYVLGAPITLQSIHQYNVDHGYTTLTWDEMVEAKRSEMEMLADLLPMPAPTGEEDEEDGADEAAAE